MRPSDHAKVPAHPDRIPELIERFTAMWDEALRGGPRPAVEDFLGELSEAERSDLRVTLGRVDEEYHQREGNVPTPPVEQTVEFADRAAVDTEFDLDLTIDSVGRHA